MTTPVYILGGYQTDFARNWRKEELNLRETMGEVVQGVLEATGMEAHEVDTAHVGNFAGRAVRKAGSAGRLFRRDRPGLRRDADVAARGGLRLGLDFDSDGGGRARGRAATTPR